MTDLTVSSAIDTFMQAADQPGARTALGLGGLAVKTTAAEGDLSLSDVTTANASTSAHGFLPKLPSDPTTMLTGGWFGVGAVIPDFRQFAWLYDDFIGGGTVAPFVTASAGTGAGVSFADTDANGFGIISLATGTQTTGRTQLGLAASGTPNNILLGIGPVVFTTRAKVTALSNGTDTYTTRIGFGAAVGGGDPTNGILFRYTDSVNSGKWQAVCRSGGTETASDTGITADTSMHRFEFVVNAGGTSVDFYIDGSKVVTVSTNVPTGTGHATAVQIMHSKSAGTTSVNLDLDWVGIGCYFTSRR